MPFDWALVPGSTIAMEPWAWDVHLSSRQRMIIYADVRGVEDGTCVFDIALTGAPLILMPVTRAPVTLVEDAYSEFANEHKPTGFDWSAVEGATIAARPTAWRVVLRTGDSLVIYAHGHHVEGGEYVFTLPLAEPALAMPVARIPGRIVSGVTEMAALD